MKLPDNYKPKKKSLKEQIAYDNGFRDGKLQGEEDGQEKLRDVIKALLHIA